MSRWDGIDEFVATAEAESFSKAALRLGLSTSGVSRAVAGLEERLQTRLLYRTTRRVSLTDAGRAFLARCRQLILDRDEALAAVGEEDGELKGLLRMTCSTAYGERFVAPAVNSFMLNHPKLSILIELDDAVRDIVSEGFDLAIRFGRLTDSRLIAKRLASRTRRLCAAPAYLARAGAPRTIDELSRRFLINPSSLKEMFKAVYGKSLAAHIKEHRMELASELLRDTCMSVAEIAERVGYENQSKFSAEFKKSVGSLPTEYRRNLLGANF